MTNTELSERKCEAYIEVGRVRIPCGQDVTFQVEATPDGHNVIGVCEHRFGGLCGYFGETHEQVQGVLNNDLAGMAECNIAKWESAIL